MSKENSKCGNALKQNILYKIITPCETEDKMELEIIIILDMKTIAFKMR